MFVIFFRHRKRTDLGSRFSEAKSHAHIAHYAESQYICLVFVLIDLVIFIFNGEGYFKLTNISHLFQYFVVKNLIDIYEDLCNLIQSLKY